MLRNSTNLKEQHHNLPMMLLHARETMLIEFEPILNQHCLTNQQWRIMSALNDHGHLSEKQLCAICQVLTLSIHTVLNRMCSLELIEIARSDTQEKIISLSDNGKNIMNEIMPMLSDKYAEIENSYGSDVLDSLYTALGQVLKHNNKYQTM